MNEARRARGLAARVGVPAWAAADALAMVALVYRGVDRLLLGTAGALSLGAALGGAAGWLGAACVVAVIDHRLGARLGTVGERERPGEAPTVIIALALLAVLAGEAVLPVPAAVRPLAWTWHSLPGELDAAMHVSTDAAKAALVAWVSVVWALALGGTVARRWVRVVLGVWTAAAVTIAFGAEALAESRLLAALAALGPLVVLALAESGRGPAAARAALAVATLSFVAVHETGLIPLLAPAKGVTRFDDTTLARLTAPEHDGIRLAITALAVASDGRHAAAALDDSEGLARIDLASGAVTGLGLGAPLSALAIDGASGVGVGWSPERRELLSFRLDPLTIRRSALVPGHPTGALDALAVRPGRVLLAHRAGAGLDEYALDSMSFLTERGVGAGGVEGGAGESAEADSGAYVVTEVAADAASGAAFVALASVSDPGDRQLLRIAPGRRGARTRVAAGASDALALASAPGGAATVLLGNARTGVVQRFDAATLAALGAIESGVDVRALAWEPRRGVAFALGKLSRKLVAIDVRLGRVVKRGQLERVPRALALDAAGDRLLIGDDGGLAAIDLGRWLYPAPPA